MRTDAKGLGTMIRRSFTRVALVAAVAAAAFAGHAPGAAAQAVSPEESYRYQCGHLGQPCEVDPPKRSKGVSSKKATRTRSARGRCGRRASRRESRSRRSCRTRSVTANGRLGRR